MQACCTFATHLLTTLRCLAIWDACSNQLRNAVNNALITHLNIACLSPILSTARSRAFWLHVSNAANEEAPCIRATAR